MTTARERGIQIQHLAPMFRGKMAEPYWVKYDYLPELQHRPIHMTTHSGQEFDLIVSGTLKVQVGDHVELLNEGDSIFYDSSTPHGMIAVDGQDCVFLAVVLPGEEVAEAEIRDSLVMASKAEDLVCEKFVHAGVGEDGTLKRIEFTGEDQFNFAFDVVDALADKYPDKLAMLHLDKDKQERKFTFKDMKRAFRPGGQLL